MVKRVFLLFETVDNNLQFNLGSTLVLVLQPISGKIEASGSRHGTWRTQTTVTCKSTMFAFGHCKHSINSSSREFKNENFDYLVTFPCVIDLHLIK